MFSFHKALGALAAAAFVAVAPPVVQAQDMLDDDTVVVPSDEGGAVIDEGAPGATQETVVPGSEGGDSTVVITAPRAAPPVNQTVVEIGGGAQTFSGELGDTLQGGAGWTGRVIFGAKSPIGLELGYAGSVNPIEGQGIGGAGDFGDLDTDNSVTTNQGEGLLRVNFAGPRSPVKPFVAGGANYTRMDSNTTFDNLDAIGFPLAAGLQFYPANNFSIGARGEYKILTEWVDDNLPSGDQWGGMLTVGANF